VTDREEYLPVSGCSFCVGRDLNMWVIVWISWWT